MVKSKGHFTLKIDGEGKATLSGKAGRVKFSVTEEIQQFGIDLKYASILFSGNTGGTIHYKAAFSFAGIAEVSFTSVIDVEQLILSCSGLLCRAARLLKGRHRRIDRSLYNLNKTQ